MGALEEKMAELAGKPLSKLTGGQLEVLAQQAEAELEEES